MAKRKRRCTAKTKAGKPCKANPRGDTGLCNAHSPKEVQESSGFGGAQEGAGRPRLPRPHEMMRERIEADIDAVLAPLFDGLEASAGIVIRIGDGQDVLETVPDHKTRMMASRELLDRVYGKAKQSIEHKGDDLQPISGEVRFTFDDDTREAISGALTRRAAPGKE